MAAFTALPTYRPAGCVVTTFDSYKLPESGADLEMDDIDATGAFEK